MPDQFRIITMDGKVSKELFRSIRNSDNKNRLVVESESGARLTIHKRRVLSVDSLGKAIALRRGTTVKAVCPSCSKVIEVVDDKIVCPDHGEFETTSHDQKPQLVNMIKRSKPQKNRSTQPMAQQAKKVTNTAADAATTNAAVGITVDLDEIEKHGLELWTKPQLNFDHVTMDVRAHVLLADNPVRKLCFNTYDGTLGKKKEVKDLHLAEFQANNPIQDKKLWHVLKGTLDEARQHLEKKSYTRA